MTKDLAHIDVLTKLVQQLKLEQNIIALQINALERSLELMEES